MSRILFATIGSLGDLHPYIGLALELKKRGHDPVIATSAYHRSAVQHEGIGFHEVLPDVRPDDPALMSRVMHPSRGPAVVLREIVLPQLRASYEALSVAARNADLLVSHPLTFAVPVIAERDGRRWVSTILSPMSLFSVHDPPVFPNMVRLATFGHGRPLIGRLLKRVAKTVTWTWTEPVRRLRRELRLPRGEDPIYDGQFSPYLTLALFSKQLASEQPDWPPNVMVTGQVFYDGGAHPVSPALEEFLAGGAPPIVFTLGSSAVESAGSFYEESIKAVAELNVRAVLLVGRNRPRTLLPTTVFAADYVPHSAIFPRAAAIVHQGGIGTMGQALRAGRPMLVVPYGFDQPDNAARVVRLGIARSLSARRYSASRAARELRILIENRQYRERAEAVGRFVRAETGVQAACDALEAELRQPVPTARPL